ncbi:hypothetical protein ACIGO9_29985 [Nocardia asteroides]|uniref:hypothetical protein n=1 Tax=Nocardia asteroides TaxID=1824 RepID=UPI0037CADDB0
MQTVVERTAHLVRTVTGMAPVHAVTDPAKLAALKASMSDTGWQGAPLVADGDQAVTGAHRHAAVVALRAEGIFLDFPAVQVADLAAEYDIDWGEIRDEYTEWDRYIEFADRLPTDVVDYFGFDLH